MEHFGYVTSLTSPGDLVTMALLALIIFIVEGRREVEMQELWLLMLAAIIPVAVWAAFAGGIGLPAWLILLGMFVIYGVVLYTREGISFPGATIGATVLLIANAGVNALMK